LPTLAYNSQWFSRKDRRNNAYTFNNGFRKVHVGGYFKVSRFTIDSVTAREILDSRGNPTVEVDVITRTGVLGRADTPAGRSRGTHEAVEIRDGGRRYGGLGVRKAVEIVNRKLAPLLRGMDARRQRDIDRKMIEFDGTENKSKLGGNVTVAASWAVAKAAANALSVPI
jgi:enolase